MKPPVTPNAESLLGSALRLCSGLGVHPTALQGLKVIRRERTTDPLPVVYGPCVCFVLQGEKNVWSGKKVYRYNPSTYLVSCLDIPVTSQLSVASPARPFVCLMLDLQPSLVYEILQDTLPPARRQTAATEGGLFVETVTPELADAFGRLLRTLESANDVRVLAPSIVREIHYRLMDSRFGTRVRQLGVVGSKTQKIGKVVEQMRKDYATPLKVTELARMVNMSVSAFHEHFREVTNLSPLQYQKHIRLQEARRLLSTQLTDAATVAYQVGYESPSQFSREYRRLFGAPPMHDLEHLRNSIGPPPGVSK
jgi:AraC-like DNA-binding protein